MSSDSAQGRKEELKGSAQDKMDQAGQKKEDMKGTAQEKMEQTKDQASGMFQQMGDKVKQAADKTKETLAGTGDRMTADNKKAWRAAQHTDSLYRIASQQKVEVCDLRWRIWHEAVRHVLEMPTPDVVQLVIFAGDYHSQNLPPFSFAFKAAKKMVPASIQMRAKKHLQSYEQSIEWLVDFEKHADLHSALVIFTRNHYILDPPSRFMPRRLAQWFDTVLKVLAGDIDLTPVVRQMCELIYEDVYSEASFSLPRSSWIRDCQSLLFCRHVAEDNEKGVYLVEEENEHEAFFDDKSGGELSEYEEDDQSANADESTAEADQMEQSSEVQDANASNENLLKLKIL
ncbi:hypothetical protein SELMODRAFT_426045 [Selaginella moellendorffii]|uniref:Uncharacterized protein n=1 Tax=Selaginella moellendorffii TaxID=88036 RepID=D8SV51_SELML|nr:hypothetical protein SELMODRAFT_426045 [Selaginella moellendorffii]